MSEHKHVAGMPPTWSIRRWLFTTNHKDVGILYLITSLYFFVAAGLLALLVRTQLAIPENAFLGSAAYNQAITVHGLLMVLWFLSPFALGFANYIVPLQIGAKDMAFPRLNSMSYWFYLFSGILMLMTFFTGGAPDGGWTLYAPLTSSEFSPFLGLNVGAAGLLMLIGSITLGSVNFLVTIFRMRAPGMKLRHMPMFTWSMLVTVAMMLYAFPSLLAGVLILFADRALGTMYFSSTEGGSLLWDHIFWFFGHPEVYIVLFPGIGIIGEILPTFTRRPLYGRKYVIMSLVAAGVISFVVWGHHMFITGINPTITKLFTLTTIAVSLPFDVIVIAMIETLVRGRIRLKAPALFAIGALMLFIIGGITGVFLASVALDYHLRGTYWVVSHFHYVMVGGSVMALIGGLYYWFPKMTGRMYNESMAKIHFILSFIGFNLLYFPMYLLLDMPRRISTYSVESGWGAWNLWATVGGFLFGMSQLLLFYNLFVSMRNGKSSGPNPWKAATLEWSVSSPPPIHNFDTIPVISGGTINLKNGNGHQNEITQNNIDNDSNDIHETHLSYWPVLIGLSTFTFLLGLISGSILLYISIPLAIATIYAYSRENFIAHQAEGETWPFPGISNVKLGVWFFLASEVIFFGALIASYLFVRSNSVSWTFEGHAIAGEILKIEPGAINTFILLTSSLTAVLALVASRQRDKRGLIASLAATFILGFAFLMNKGMEWAELIHEGFTFSSGLPATSYFLTTGAHGVHIIGGLVILMYLMIRSIQGYYSKGDSKTIEHFGLYWHFVDIVWVFLFPLFYLI